VQWKLKHKVERKVGWLQCSIVRELMHNIIKKWDHSMCHHDTDEHCWYHQVNNTGLKLEVSHATHLLDGAGVRRDHIINDTMKLSFTDVKGGCLVDGNSLSPKGVKYDYGTNYCNLRNLLDAMINESGISDIADVISLDEEHHIKYPETSRNECSFYHPNKKSTCHFHNCCLSPYPGRDNQPAAVQQVDNKGK
jgi:hypothetical protein